MPSRMRASLCRIRRISKLTADAETDISGGGAEGAVSVDHLDVRLEGTHHGGFLEAQPADGC